MKFNQATYERFALINGVKIFVPYGINYVTINMNYTVYGWSDRPFISEGVWDSLIGPGYRLGSVVWDDENDSGHFKVYEVQS